MGWFSEKGQSALSFLVTMTDSLAEYRRMMTTKNVWAISLGMSLTWPAALLMFIVGLAHCGVAGESRITTNRIAVAEVVAATGCPPDRSFEIVEPQGKRRPIRWNPKRSIVLYERDIILLDQGSLRLFSTAGNLFVLSGKTNWSASRLTESDRVNPTDCWLCPKAELVTPTYSRGGTNANEQDRVGIQLLGVQHRDSSAAGDPSGDPLPIQLFWISEITGKSDETFSVQILDGPTDTARVLNSVDYYIRPWKRYGPNGKSGGLGMFDAFLPRMAVDHQTNRWVRVSRLQSKELTPQFSLPKRITQYYSPRDQARLSQLAAECDGLPPESRWILGRAFETMDDPTAALGIYLELLKANHMARNAHARVATLFMERGLKTAAKWHQTRLEE